MQAYFFNSTTGESRFEPFTEIEMRLKKHAGDHGGCEQEHVARQYMHYSEELKDSLGNIILPALKKPEVEVPEKYTCHGCRFLRYKECPHLQCEKPDSAEKYYSCGLFIQSPIESAIKEYFATQELICKRIFEELEVEK
jgi:hypothetical protein